MKRVRAILILAFAIAIAGLTVSFTLLSRAQSKLRTRAERFEKQRINLLSLQREHDRLAKLAVNPKNCSEDACSEIAQLRAELESLRQKTNRVVIAPAAMPNIPAPTPNASHELYGVENVVSESPSDEYKHELYKIGASSPHSGEFNIDARKDAQNLTHSVRTFARAHDGEIPATFDDAAEHLFKEYRAPLADDYEIVFHGSINDLTNIPAQVVAIVRERQPWPTPSGKLGRLYGMASGFVRIVESDDNFQTWEAEHIIPPR